MKSESTFDYFASTVTYLGRHGKPVAFYSEDGRVEIPCAGLKLPYSMIDKQPHVSAGVVVENKRLGAVLATILAKQTERDAARLASRDRR
ncbi:MAG: hypothetical protein ABIS92_06505 [Polyangia bacterium]